MDTTGSSTRSFALPIHYDTKHPWVILFYLNGSLWGAVIPYCILNCGITYLVYLASYHGIKITFSVQGHAFMSLLVSYLVVSKVFLSLERYMACRTSAGHALTTLRELHQLALTFTEEQSQQGGRGAEEVRIWQRQVRERIVALINSTIRVIRNEEKASFLAYNVLPATHDDPMVHAQLLRSHLYRGSDVLPKPFEIIEKVKLNEQLGMYLNAYREALKLASTPLPFTMIQMGRTFLFLWTFTIPFALVGVIGEIVSELIFVFFLTYGYIGLEFVSMRLLHPWGDGINDINIVGMGQAVVVGMENDFNAMSKRRGGFQKKNLDGSGGGAAAVYVVGSDPSQSTIGSDQDSNAHYYAYM